MQIVNYKRRQLFGISEQFKVLDKMKCKNCKYRKNIANTSETGSAICSYSNSWFPINIENNCYFIPEKKELTCGDCSRLTEDTACFGCSEDDSALYNGQLCRGFVDEREAEFKQILMFWKVQEFYDRERINKLIDEFEQFYDNLLKQEQNGILLAVIGREVVIEHLSSNAYKSKERTQYLV